jgi:chain length determinant protein EpsF
MNLHQFLLALWARKRLILVTIFTTVAVAIAVSLVLPAKYTATASIVIDFKALDPVSGNVLPAVLLPGYLATQLDVISSHRVALKAVDALKLTESPEAKAAFEEQAEGKGNIRDWMAELLLKDIKLAPSRESSLVNISYRANDPRFAAAAANAIVRAYIETNLELKVEPASQTATFFNEQVDVLKRNLDTAQKKLSSYQGERGITATDERFDVENARLAELSSQVVTAQAQSFDSRSRERQVNAAIAKGGSPDALSDVLLNPVIQNLKSTLAQAEGKLSDLSSRVGTNHPQYRAALAEVDELKRKLADEMHVVAGTVNSSASLAAQREGSVRSALEAQKMRVLSLKKQRDEGAVLVREVENAQRAYDAAMARFTQTRLESQSTQTNIAVIDPATEPGAPSFPKMKLNIAVALVVGSVLAIGLALVAEMLDRVVRSEQDITSALEIPVLGSISIEPTARVSRLKLLLGRMGSPQPVGDG